MKLIICAAAVSSLVDALAIRDYSVSINHNTVTKSPNVDYKDFSIAAGKHFAAVNSKKVQLSGNFENEGEFYVTNSGDSRVRMSIIGDTVENRGKFAINSLTAETTPGFFIRARESFVNSGEMYLGDSGAESAVFPITISSANSWYNSGSMVFRRESGPRVPLDLRGSLFDIPSIENYGSICLYNTLWETKTSIIGSGCISVGSGSLLELALDKDQVLQAITLESADSDLKISKFGTSLSAPVIRIAGFGGNNKISFDKVIEGTDKLSYSEETGRLSILDATKTVLLLDIGTGYDAGEFKVTQSESGSTVVYDKAVPQDSRQDGCGCVSEFPNSPRVPGS
ncbi:hypothetical protein METBIDRAFT_30503 [Metschnikowia bicuspidata var. bicuspidata NRRL YB-4993]|uniref:Hyphally-regulated cell wall protein N-terminal domain-containing protein n=1 Tax=Metschnikowia bicuspidata var. bicuspidata NRRL YB-4993 TaxID=869754 RepID=A0A1A0HJ45_9ASCO|nr:hypothetical protein METBIDRAFT_30503 [Metschnikowia bicuspidata var. bicuspidata NRRL YB-4993]OBA24174.1 hypothetical protein METBIDRAFT_30503 [Metschnikowia bicuspidata var. bicuspidata NRRL YB-4993]